MKTSLRVLPVALLVVLAGCPKRLEKPSGVSPEAFEQASRQTLGPEATARAFALAGFSAYLSAADPKAAQARFDEALARDAREPYALLGELLLARRRGQPERALLAALDLCERAARHPLASVGARYILDMTGTAVSLDDQILAGAPKALAAGAAGDTAQLLRSALAGIAAQRGDTARHDQLNAEMAVPTRYTLVGPFSPFQLLSFDDLTPPEKTGALDEGLSGPLGPLPLRELPTFGGRIGLGGESSEGDQYILAVDAEVREAGDYALRVVTSTPHKVYLDGTRVAENRGFQRLGPTVASRAVRLSVGVHRLIIRTVKEDRAGTFVLSVMRLDGKPARIGFSPARGPAPRWNGVEEAKPHLLFPTAQSLADALSPEVGDVLGTYLAIRDAMGRDREGAKALMQRLQMRLQGPALTSLRADLSLGDRAVPSRVARGRATRDLEATTDKDPGDVNAFITRASIALEDARGLEALEFLKQARAAQGDSGEKGYLVPLIEARAQLSLNLDAQAEQSAQKAEQARPGLCEALNLRLDLAVRRDAVKASDALLQELHACPGNLYRTAEHARARGELARAATLYGELVARDPGQISSATRLSSLLVGLRRFDEAAQHLSALRKLWPRNAGLLKQLADLRELAGKRDEALALREEALRLDGSDLSLRRAVHRAKTGKELLSEYAIDTKAALENYEKSRRAEETPYVYVLDAAAIQGFPDGSTVERIHVIQKAVEQTGVSEIAEVSIPGNAQLLLLRTLKADGTMLEPENIEGKDTISLPGVQVGDFVEFEYLVAHPSRGPLQPGFTASNFYFQIARVPNHWSTYVVTAPKGSGLKVDAHNMKPPEVEVREGLEVFSYDEREVPPYLPEPDSPRAGTEVLPFVAVGVGAEGNQGVVNAYADGSLERGQVTYEVEKFAQQAAAGQKGLAAIKAVYSAVMHRIAGRDAGLTSSAAATLAQERGSRTWLLKASLEALGIPARLVAIRTFASDPSPFLFPNDALLPYVALRAEVPGEGVVWLDPAIRFGPFGELPEQALGGREGWLFPEPGRPLAQVKTPPNRPRAPKDIRLKLTLSEEGRLSGEGIETYEGFEAARLGEALDQLSPDQRNQSLQSALSRYFGGAELTKVKVELRQEVGAPFVVRYAFTVPTFARKEGDTLVLPPITFPARLGKRFVQLSTRKSPLYLDETERTHTSVELTVPPGMQFSGIEPELKAQSPYGTFSHRETQVDGKLRINEIYGLDAARIPPREYEGFAAFAGEVDLIQQRELVLHKP